MMTISGNNWLISGAERAYHNFRPQVGLNPASKTHTQSAKNNIAAQNGAKVSAPKDILSGRELETLQALFSGIKTEDSFYGLGKVKSTQSGFLLDIKG